MSNETVFAIILLLGGVNILIGVIVGVYKRSILWGIAGMLLGALMLFVFILGGIAFGRTRVPTPTGYDTYTNDRYWHPLP